MGPKVRAALQFLDAGGGCAVITRPWLRAERPVRRPGPLHPDRARRGRRGAPHDRRVRLLPDTYLDSVVQLAGSRAMRQVDGVEWAAVAMATPANVETLREQGFDAADLAGAGAGDLVLAVRAADGATVDAAFDAAQQAMFAAREPATGGGAAAPPRSLDDALREQPGTTVAVISVPGDYAALEAHKALAARPGRPAVQRQRAGRGRDRAQGARRPARPPAHGAGRRHGAARRASGWASPTPSAAGRSG